MRSNFSLRSPSVFAVITLLATACASSPRTSLPAGETPQQAVDKVSMELGDATNNQYAQVSPDLFDKAGRYRNSARDRIAKGGDSQKVLEDAASAEFYVSEVNRVGDAGKGVLAEVLRARSYAVQAQAPQFEEKKFRSAESDLKDLGADIAKGNTLNAEDVRKVEVEYSEAEVPARQRAELGSTRSMLNQAKNDGAEKTTPTLYGQAASQLASAEHSITMSPHNASEYAASVQAARSGAQQLSDVLAIARQKNISEDAALTIYNQDKALAASKSELEKTKADADEKLTHEKATADAEQAKLQGELAVQNAALSDLSAQNKQFADKAQLEARIQELKEKFSDNEAEVVKDGKNVVVRLRDMKFATGRSDLNPDSFSTLQKVDSLIAALPVEQVTVEGHTDSTGNAGKNRELSEKRAEAVKKYLLSQGLADNLKVETEGYGSDRPLTSNKTRQGRATNRRVDIVIQTPVVL